MANLRTPLYPWHVANKARIVPFAGWDMPVQYAGIIEEHKAVRTAAGLFDVSHMGRLIFTSTERLAVIEGAFTNSVATMKEGQVRYGLVCKEDGGILDDVLVYRLPDRYLMVANASNAVKVAVWMHRQIGERKAILDDVTAGSSLIAVQGPKAVELVKGLFGDDVSRLKYYFATMTEYQGVRCLVSRTGYTGEDGFEIMVDNGLALPLWEHLIARGAVPCGLGARDTLRLEAAMPLYGHELTEQTDPISAGLGWAVKLDKGEFVGRNALRMAAELTSASRVRVGLELEGKRAAREGCPIELGDGRAVGGVTSGSYAPFLEKSIAMGYVEFAHSSVGTRLLVDVRGAKLPAAVVPLPFYKRAK